MKKKKKEIIEEPVVEVIEESTKKEVKEIPDFYMLRVTETIGDVAKKFGISEKELMKLNNSSTFIGGNQIKLK